MSVDPVSALLKAILLNADEDIKNADEAPEYRAEFYVRWLEGERKRLLTAPQATPDLLSRLTAVLMDVTVTPVEARIQALRLVDAAAAAQAAVAAAAPAPDVTAGRLRKVRDALSSLLDRTEGSNVLTDDERDEYRRVAGTAAPAPAAEGVCPSCGQRGGPYCEDEWPDPENPITGRTPGAAAPLCPNGCGCRLGTEDADAHDCACDGLCCYDEIEVSELFTERDKLRAQLDLARAETAGIRAAAANTALQLAEAVAKSDRLEGQNEDLRSLIAVIISEVSGWSRDPLDTDQLIADWLEQAGLEPQP